MILFYSTIAFFIGSALFFAFKAKSEARPLVLLWSYCVISASAVGIYPYFNVAGQPHALMALTLLIAVPGMIIVLCKTNNLKSAISFLASLMYLNAGITFYQGWGLANAGSFDAAIFMATLPLFINIKVFELDRSDWFHTAFGVFFVGWTQSNTGAMILAAYGAFYMLQKGKKGLLFGLGLIALSIAFFHKKGGSSGFARLEGWKHYMGMWTKDANQFLGSGIGTFQGMGPLLPEVPSTKEVYLYMHNDYLQILFEGGAIGFVLLLFSIAWLFSIASSARLKFAVIGFAVCMITYSPLHVMIGQLAIGILVLKIIYERNEYAKRN